MNRTLLKKLLIGLFLGVFLILLGLFNASKPRILVLHSFAADDPWVIELNKGIKTVLKGNRHPVTVKYHYLDVLKNEKSGGMSVAVNGARQAISRMNPDLVIAVDDESNELVARSYAGKTRPRIVFAATLQTPESYGYAGAVNVSGIKEQLPLDAVRDTLLTARGGKPARIAVLGMQIPTCKAELKQVQSFNWAPHRLVATQMANDFPAWQQFTTRMADQADVLLILSYGALERAGGEKGEVPGIEMASWIEKNAKPLPISIYPTYVEDGGGLEISPAPADFGKEGMQMALKWVAARKGSAPPAIRSSPHFMVGIRQSLLDARGITMPPIYIEAARIGDDYFP